MPLVVRGRSMAEKTKEQLQIEAEKAKQKADAGEAALKEAKDESSKTRNPETGKKRCGFGCEARRDIRSITVPVFALKKLTPSMKCRKMLQKF